MSSRGILLKVIAPVVIGMAVVAYLFYREFNPAVWGEIDFDWRAVCAIALAWVCMGGRDFGLSWRFRAITDRRLTWGQSVRVCMMCEFTSCVTPSVVGGSALGMVFMNREGIELGRATTLTLVTLFLDELFFVVSLPVVMLFVPYGDLFGFDGGMFTMGLQTVFWLVYSGLVIYTGLLFVGIIVKPTVVKCILSTLFRLPLLKRWRPKVETLGDNMAVAGMELRGCSFGWWLKAFFATAVSWLSRYLIVNALFWGFVPGIDQLVAFARQSVVWVVLLVSPTPGGSGLSEWLFTEYYGDMINSTGIALVIALLWRVITYYVYLVIGAFMIPSWVRGKFGVRN